MEKYFNAPNFAQYRIDDNIDMSTTKDYLDFVLEQLSDLPDIT